MAAGMMVIGPAVANSFFETRISDTLPRGF